MPRSLDLERLRRFEPENQPPSSAARPERAGEPPVERWPSREPLSESQISIKAPLETLARFKKLCRDDRRTYADMLRILMDAFEEEKRP